MKLKIEEMNFKIGDKAQRIKDNKIGIVVNVEPKALALKYRIDFKDVAFPFWYSDEEIRKPGEVRT